jgi:hypothetical protein
MIIAVLQHDSLGSMYPHCVMSAEMRIVKPVETTVTR